MELTVFPPFNVTVDAADALTALGGAIRIAADGDRLCIEIAQPHPGDSVFSCPGASIAVEPRLLPLLRHATVDFHDILGFTVDGVRPRRRAAAAG